MVFSVIVQCLKNRSKLETFYIFNKNWQARKFPNIRLNALQNLALFTSKEHLKCYKSGRYDLERKAVNSALVTLSGQFLKNDRFCPAIYSSYLAYKMSWLCLCALKLVYSSTTQRLSAFEVCIKRARQVHRYSYEYQLSLIDPRNRIVLWTELDDHLR